MAALFVLGRYVHASRHLHASQEYKQTSFEGIPHLMALSRAMIGCVHYVPWTLCHQIAGFRSVLPAGVWLTQQPETSGTSLKHKYRDIRIQHPYQGENPPSLLLRSRSLTPIRALLAYLAIAIPTHRVSSLPLRRHEQHRPPPLPADTHNLIRFCNIYFLANAM